MNVAEDFETQQERLFAIAYRMLGRVSDAEDVVQGNVRPVEQRRSIQGR